MQGRTRRSNIGVVLSKYCLRAAELAALVFARGMSSLNTAVDPDLGQQQCSVDDASLCTFELITCAKELFSLSSASVYGFVCFIALF